MEEDVYNEENKPLRVEDSDDERLGDEDEKDKSFSYKDFFHWLSTVVGFTVYAGWVLSSFSGSVASVIASIGPATLFSFVALGVMNAAFHLKDLIQHLREREWFKFSCAFFSMACQLTLALGVGSLGALMMGSAIVSMNVLLSLCRYSLIGLSLDHVLNCVIKAMPNGEDFNKDSLELTLPVYCYLFLGMFVGSSVAHTARSAVLLIGGSFCIMGFETYRNRKMLKEVGERVISKITNGVKTIFGLETSLSKEECFSLMDEYADPLKRQSSSQNSGQKIHFLGNIVIQEIFENLKQEYYQKAGTNQQEGAENLAAFSEYFLENLKGSGNKGAFAYISSFFTAEPADELSTLCDRLFSPGHKQAACSSIIGTLKDLSASLDSYKNRTSEFVDEGEARSLFPVLFAEDRGVFLAPMQERANAIIDKLKLLIDSSFCPAPDLDSSYSPS